MFGVDVSVCPNCAGPMKWREVALTQNTIREGLASAVGPRPSEATESAVRATLASVSEETSCSPTSLDRSPGAHGPEFISKAVQDWAKERGIKWHCIEPGKPTQNSHIESFNGKLRDECLNQNYWKDLAEVRKETSEYRRDDLPPI